MTSDPTQFHVDVLRVGDVAVVTLDGQLDAAQAAHLRAAVNRIVGDAVESLVLDVSRLDFVDSAGLAVIANASRALPGGIVVRGAGPTLMRLLRITGLDTLVELRPVG